VTREESLVSVRGLLGQVYLMWKRQLERGHVEKAWKKGSTTHDEDIGRKALKHKKGVFVKG